MVRIKVMFWCEIQSPTRLKGKHTNMVPVDGSDVVESGSLYSSLQRWYCHKCSSLKFANSP